MDDADAADAPVSCQRNKVGQFLPRRGGRVTVQIQSGLHRPLAAFEFADDFAGDAVAQKRDEITRLNIAIPTRGIG